MKRIHILLAAALTLFACSKSEIPVYRLEDSAVCFQSVNNNFSMRSLTEPTRDLTIPVVLIGQVTDYARPISFSRDGGTAVEGQDYTLVSAEVPAGSLTGSIVLRANRLEGITEKTLDLIDEKYGSLPDYVQNQLGFTKKEQKQLRKKYLTTHD